MNVLSYQHQMVSNQSVERNYIDFNGKFIDLLNITNFGMDEVFVSYISSD